MFPFFNEANETLGVQFMIINNKSNPLLPLLLFIIDLFYCKASKKTAPKSRFFSTRAPLVSLYNYNRTQRRRMYLHHSTPQYTRNYDMLQLDHYHR